MLVVSSKMFHGLETFTNKSSYFYPENRLANLKSLEVLTFPQGNYERLFFDWLDSLNRKDRMMAKVNDFGWYLSVNSLRYT